MIKNKQQLKVMALALSLPTSAFAVIWGVMELADQGIFPRWVALIIILSTLFNFFLMMIWYAKKKKPSKSKKKEHGT